MEQITVNTLENHMVKEWSNGKELPSDTNYTTLL